jgi:hypothetical protein
VLRKLHTLAVTRSKNFAHQQNFHIEQFHGHSDKAKQIDLMLYMEVLFVGKILAGPKTLCDTGNGMKFWLEVLTAIKL